jgi:hypothetical protein
MWPERIGMYKTARCWFEEFTEDKQHEFLRTVLANLRHKLYPQHRLLADHYCQQAFLKWWDDKKLIEDFQAILVVRRAHYLYLNDVAAQGRLQVEDYDAYVESAEASGQAQSDINPLIETILSNRQLLELIKNSWPTRYLRYFEAIMVHEPYQAGRIDNEELRTILGIDDIEEVRRALDCIRRKLKRAGFSPDMIS